ncbi:protein G49 [Vespertilionid gammaherpesvirus 1]|uniref:Protein G49 n=1 Tax=Vespertilionid gammaherpesvirus 1 TaxID=2560830 RepID=A0A109Q967_9GAMA|nr:protein G49 [Myotis gammaherpesvirus 8]AMA67405.1 protein G49 [Vespertilionid gammaherpesvirus 1]
MQSKTILNSLHFYHIPPETEVIQELNSFTSKYAEEVHLQKIIFLLKLCERIFQNKQNEPLILEAVTRNINHSLQNLLEYTEIEDIATDVKHILKISTRYSKELTAELDKTLPKIVKKQYPQSEKHIKMDISDKNLNSCYSAWATQLMTTISDPRDIIVKSLKRTDTSMFSLHKFCGISLHFHKCMPVYRNFEDVDFNEHFNLIVFWTAVLKKFEHIHYSSTVDEYLLEYIALLKDEAKKLSRLLMFAYQMYNIGQKFIQTAIQKVEDLELDTCGVFASEAAAFFYDIKRCVTKFNKDIDSDF